MHKFISYGRQAIDEDDVKYLIDTLKSDYLTQGPRVLEFEKAICDYTGAKYCVAVANGTAALHIAVKALGITSGEGITSCNTFVASSNALVYNSIKPIFSDIDGETYNLDLQDLEKRINKDTKIIIPVHFAGEAVDMEKVNDLAKKNDLFVIEDAAHAIGSRYKNGKKVGSCIYSDMTTFSFHPVKTITTGEGGAITTNNLDLYKKLLLLRSHGITKDENLFENENAGPWYYEMQDLGFNYRITDFQCALGITQLKKLDKFIERRREICRIYIEAFQDIKNIKVPDYKNIENNAYHLFVLQIDFDKIGKTRKQVMTELLAKNIGTQVHYIPVHTQPYYVKNFGYKNGDYPVCEEYYKKALSIPLFPTMTDEDVQYVIKSLMEVLSLGEK